MSDAYIVRRGKIIQGGGGFDPNGAVLKVVTSTGCSVTVTGTGYSQTQQDGDGFPRSDDANVTEHFFSIPASAFGDIDVSVRNQYSGETITNSRTIDVETAGKVYEMYITTPNILLNSRFGKQDGFSITAPAGCSAIYDSDYKTYTLEAPANGTYYFDFTKAYDVSPYSYFKITSRLGASYATITPCYVYATNKDNEDVFERGLGGNPTETTVSVSLTDKTKSPFVFGFSKKYNYAVSLIISEIVLL